MVKIAIKPKTEISPLKRKMKKFAKVNQSNKHTLRPQWKYYHYCLWWRKCFRQSTENIRKSDRMWIGMSRRYHKNDRLSLTNVIVMHRISEWKNAKINLDRNEKGKHSRHSWYPRWSTERENQNVSYHDTMYSNWNHVARWNRSMSMHSLQHEPANVSLAKSTTIKIYRTTFTKGFPLTFCIMSTFNNSDVPINSGNIGSFDISRW